MLSSAVGISVPIHFEPLTVCGLSSPPSLLHPLVTSATGVGLSHSDVFARCLLHDVSSRQAMRAVLVPCQVDAQMLR